ncbi:hypothetical protein, partial [Parvibaculum sp.]|uniref:hypothetical protein n=1 Tax=Parvibaculum sp. TaxID=2024848 RepID=UPI0025E195CE
SRRAARRRRTLPSCIRHEFMPLVTEYSDRKRTHSFRAHSDDKRVTRMRKPFKHGQYVGAAFIREKQSGTDAT